MTWIMVGCAVAVAAVTAVLSGVPSRFLGDTTGSRASEGWAEGRWRDWDDSAWLRGSDDFLNPVIDGLWDSDRMRDSASRDVPVAEDAGDPASGVSDPEPAPVTAEEVGRPYQQTVPVIGKLFFDTPDGPSVCSATVITDAARPGASDLVWTAGHCVHAGADGGWYRNIVFVPSYNDRGADDPAPFGVWWADAARTSEEWITRGAPTGGAGAAFDFAVLRVQRTGDAGGASLEETIGASAAISFDAPGAPEVAALQLWGYPAAAPFDGERMFTCQDRPGRLSLDAAEPTMFRVGCTMTGGSSGGGWFIEAQDGTPVLVSNTSIGPDEPSWLAGPRLGPEAQRIYEAVSGALVP
ncbi:hypothetical protein FHX78_12117 [Streptomyces capillispiralis]|uniref:V8-like Glu-specific endopeptidase n=2 Tax=Streptomyces capillispiralis TaxID=68182 RepID=A0A561SGU4_9ACTN|nr:hypothetical protein FHX78_12117 [Streptomyces capillispiralis]